MDGAMDYEHVLRRVFRCGRGGHKFAEADIARLAAMTNDYKEVHKGLDHAVKKLRDRLNNVPWTAVEKQNGYPQVVATSALERVQERLTEGIKDQASLALVCVLLDVVCCLEDHILKDPSIIGL